MKKLLYLTGVSLASLLTSCSDSTPKPAGDTAAAPQTERNRTNNRAIMKAVETGDASALDSLIATDAVDHSGPDNNEIKGGDSIKSMLTHVHNGFKDFKLDIITDAAEGDYVFTLARETGTTTNAGMGMPANTKMDMTGVDVVKFKDGKATEHWAYVDPKDMMKMMPPQGGKMNDKIDSKMTGNKIKDTTKKK